MGFVCMWSAALLAFLLVTGTCAAFPNTIPMSESIQAPYWALAGIIYEQRWETSASSLLLKQTSQGSVLPTEKEYMRRCTVH